MSLFMSERNSLVRDYVDAMDTHGMDGLGESGWPDVKELTPKTDAVSFLIETLKTTPDVTILALGPMTNLAKVISCAPECLENLEALVSMGGSYKSHGNCSPVAEYNYWCDPDAAAEVFVLSPSCRSLPAKAPYDRAGCHKKNCSDSESRGIYEVCKSGSRNPHRGADTFLLRFSLETGKGHRMRNQRSARSRLSCGSVALQRF